MRKGRGGEVELFAVETVEVEGLEVQADPDIRGKQFFHDRVAPDPDHLELEADDEEVPRVSGRIAHRFEHLDPRDAAERLRVPRRDAGASFNELLQACELREAER